MSAMAICLQFQLKIMNTWDTISTSFNFSYYMMKVHLTVVSSSKNAYSKTKVSNRYIAHVEKQHN